MSRSPRVLSLNAVAADGRDGIAGDVAVFDELGCTPACVATAVMSASAETLTACDPIAAESIARQLASALAGGAPAAAKLGVVAGRAQAEALAPALLACVPDGLIFAPVVRVAGSELLGRAEAMAVWNAVAKVAHAVIVRAADLDTLLGKGVAEMEDLPAAAAGLRALGARTVVIAGFVTRDRVIDVVDDGAHLAVFDTGRLRVPHVAGLSGAFAAAVTAHLASGLKLPQAVQAGQRYIALRLRRGR